MHASVIHFTDWLAFCVSVTVCYRNTFVTQVTYQYAAAFSLQVVGPFIDNPTALFGDYAPTPMVRFAHQRKHSYSSLHVFSTAIVYLWK